MAMPATSSIYRNLSNSLNKIFYRVAMAIPKWVPNRLHCLIYIKHNVCDWVTEHTRDIEHYLQDEKQDNNSTTQLSDHRKSLFKESGGLADRINRKKKRSNGIH